MGLQELERGELVQAAPPGTTVDGVPVARVARPGSVEEASQVLRAAADDGLAVAFSGGGGKLGLGNPPERVDLLVSSERLDQVLEHAAGDLVVRAQAGVRLADLQQRLAPAGQWLALDPPEPRATLGGVVAANASGPRRLRYGTVRDLIIGITVVLADGTVARAGGKVVKNVAGYDLAKLFCGSLGTLGMVAEVIFRLHPVPAAAAVVTVAGGHPRAGRPGRPAAAPLGPGAERGRADRWTGGAGRAGSRSCSRASSRGWTPRRRPPSSLLGQVGEAAVAGPGETDAALSQLGALPFEKAELAFKATFPPAELAGGPGRRVPSAGVASVSAHAGTGVLWLASGAREGDLRADDPVVPSAGRVDRRGQGAAGRPRGQPGRGQGPAPTSSGQVDAWGPAGDALGLMRRVKERFDPERRMSPGRFVGGI